HLLWLRNGYSEHQVRFQTETPGGGKGWGMRTQQHIEGHAAGGQRGFTVIEILVTIAIASILAAVAVPSLSSFLRNIKLNSISGSLVASLQQARGEAIKLNQGVLVCPSNATKTDCAATTDWGVKGWLVCYDGNADGACDASTADAPNPIRVEGKVDTTFATVTGPAAAIRFAPSGSQGVAGAATVTLSITGTWSGATAVRVTVAASGLIKGGRT
ncbi:MAG: GspH/FimT family pseudopilin, partial [Burkholderiales bacterium]